MGLSRCGTGPYPGFGLMLGGESSAECARIEASQAASVCGVRYEEGV